MRTYVGDPHRCYHVTVLFYDLIVSSALVRNVTKDCDYEHI